MSRKHTRVNVLDICLIFLFLLSLIGVGLRWWDFKQPLESSADENAYVTLRLRNTAPEIAACLEVGETVYAADGSQWGKMTAIERNPSRVMLEENGVFYTGAWDENERCDLYVTVSVKGNWNGSLFLLGGKHAVTVGSTEKVYSMRTALFGTVEEINRGSGGN